MRYVVDGYNAIRRVDAFCRVEASRGLEAGRDALLSAIVASGVLDSSPVLVVFDGAADVTASMPRLHRSLTVRFSRAPESADAAIVALLQGADSSEVRVVTADRELQFSVQRLGASVVTPESWDGLRTQRKRRRRGVPPRPDKEKPKPSARDVAYWLDVFEPDGDG